MKRESTRTEQEPIRNHQETTRTTQESTRERLFIAALDFFIDLLTRAAVLLFPTLLHYRNQGGLHLAYMKGMSSLENSMVISYYFHYTLQA